MAEEIRETRGRETRPDPEPIASDDGQEKSKPETPDYREGHRAGYREGYADALAKLRRDLDRQEAAARTMIRVNM